MAGTRKDNQFDNFIQICKGYQVRNPDIQPRIPHPHLIQLSMAIIIRVRPNGDSNNYLGSNKIKCRFVHRYKMLLHSRLKINIINVLNENTV